MTKILIRNVSVRGLLDNLFVSAVATVLLIRVFLFLTGWPIIGGEKLHIAHMLWGGFFMLSAIVLLLAFLGSRIQYWAAILGGIGFGFFIDELGKFITKDNNYFFQPTFMLMYLIFVGLYFILRSLEKQIKLTEEERVINALDLSQDAILKQVDVEDRIQLMALSESSGKYAGILGQLRQMIQEADILPVNNWTKFKTWCQAKYFQFAKSQYFLPSIVGLWVIEGGMLAYSFQNFLVNNESNHLEIAIVVCGIAFATLTSFYILSGISGLSQSRILAYRRFYRGNLVSVLLMQPFALYVATFIPIIALGINLISLFGLQYLLTLEKRLQ